MNEIVKVPDIAVYHDGVFSLREQAVVKDAVLQYFNIGSGIKYAGDLYVLDSLETEIVRMSTTKTNLTFKIVSNSDIKVDWGDGTIDSNVSNHTYTDGLTEHTILFWGSDTALTELRCTISQLTALDVSKNTALTNLNCHSNQLTALDVSKNTALTGISCYGNPFTTNIQALTVMANSLFDRNGLEPGQLLTGVVMDAVVASIITAKNWGIIQ